VAIRILHVIDHLPPGGAPRVVKGIAENIDAKRFEILVWPLRANPEAISVPAEMVGRSSGRYSPYPIWALRRVCAEHGIDIVHAHLTRASICSLMAPGLYGAPVLVHEHGPVYATGRIYVVYRFLLKMLRNRPAAVIANSQATARRLIEGIGVSPEKIKVIYNAIDLDRFDGARADRAAARAALDVAAEDFVVGFVGRLARFKGVDILLRAFALLLRESRRYRLVVCGYGQERASLEGLADELGVGGRVCFLGMRGDVERIIPAFDVAVMPSRHEPFGIALLELMRMKAPVVTSGVDGMAELVRHEETALVAQPNTPETIAACIKRLESDAALRAKLAENAYAFTHSFGLAQHIAAIEDLYLQTYRAVHPQDSGS